ncbi:BQ2448_1076 [Microbotryum intermedium]|uniref:BQ2448_1076 protein n=1 Tax=Microbotryum intermedium TaxID=269621 RepID=A0A238F744_9BASI|nr:BQ2448_1076 [Microbotryum intermedium]
MLSTGATTRIATRCSPRPRPPTSAPTRTRTRVALPLQRRALSSVASTPPRTVSVTSSSSTDDALRSLGSLLDRYPLLGDSRWPERIRHASHLLNDPSQNKRATIAFAGDHWSGVSPLVTALLDEPLASNAQVSWALAARHLHLTDSEVLFIRHGDIPKATPNLNELELPSAWLEAHRVQVVELTHGDLAPKQVSVDSLFSSDVVVLVISADRSLSPASTRSLLNEIKGKPNLILALNVVDASPSSSASSLRFLSHQLSTLFPTFKDETEIVAVSSEQASSALDALQPTEATTKPDSFEHFQSTFIRSGVPRLKDEVTRLISAINRPTLHQRAAEFTLDKAIEASAVEGAKIQDGLHQVKTDIAALEFIIDEATSSVLASLGVGSQGLKVPEEHMQNSMKALRQVLDHRLAWYVLPWKTDELVAEIALVTGTTYLVEFEQHLLYSTGRLESLSSTLSQKTNELVQTRAFLPPQSSTSAPLASLHSPILLNQIQQAEKESLMSAPTTLISPLHHRRNQITCPGGPSESLQSKAQSLVVRASSMTTGSILAGVGLEITHYADLMTSAGVGLLGVTFAAWGLQRGWEKAKKRFEKDVQQRVRSGLEEDLAVSALKTAAKNLVDRSTYKARTAVALSSKRLDQRRSEFDRFKRELRAIDERRKA